MNYIKKLFLSEQIKNRKEALLKYGPHAWMNVKIGCDFEGNRFDRRKG